MSATTEPARIPVAPLSELERKGVIVATGGDRPIAVFHHDGAIVAVDNRCPHLGFPLHKGSLHDGILTCHWHEARFDVCSGCTFDLWADDIPSFETAVIDGVVHVATEPSRRPDRARHLVRLRHGLDHEIGLVAAKAILNLRKANVRWTEIVRELAVHGSANHDRWGEGMTLLSIAGNLCPDLGDETTYHAMFRASRRLAADCAGAVPHRNREALASSEHAPEQLARWLRHWVRCRHRDGAERVLLTAIDSSIPSSAFADLLFTAAGERVYAQVGHVFDACNKAFELLDQTGWERAGEVLPLVVEQLVTARGAEENAHWHHPIELIEPLRKAEGRIPELLAEGAGKSWRANDGLLDILLGDDPLAILESLQEALRAGAGPSELSKRIAYAAALRLARFALTNELADWFNPRHTFIFANAVDQALKRSPTPGVIRSLFHAALSVYMDRFLNVPPARLPEDRRLEGLPADPPQLRAHLLDQLNRQANVDGAALAVARCLRLGHDVQGLIDTLALATAREDLDFHAMQVLEAGVRQYREWQGGPEGEHILIGVARQLAAFCPTPRAGHQIATVAMRLERGDKMYEESD